MRDVYIQEQKEKKMKYINRILDNVVETQFYEGTNNKINLYEKVTKLRKIDSPIVEEYICIKTRPN